MKHVHMLLSGSAPTFRDMLNVLENMVLKKAPENAPRVMLCQYNITSNTDHTYSGSASVTYTSEN